MYTRNDIQQKYDSDNLLANILFKIVLQTINQYCCNQHFSHLMKLFSSFDHVSLSAILQHCSMLITPLKTFTTQTALSAKLYSAPEIYSSLINPQS